MTKRGLTIEGDYMNQGYVIARRLFDVDTIESVRSTMVQCFKDVAGDIALPKNNDPCALLVFLSTLFKRHFNAYLGAAKLCNHIATLYQLGVNDETLNALRSVGVETPCFAARPLVWFHHPTLARSARYERLPAHQEWSNMQGSISGAVLWSPFVDMDNTMGPLEVIEGSHTRGLGAVHTPEHSDYPLAIQHTIDDDAFSSVLIQPGDAIIFHPLLIHRSGINRSDRIRWTFNFRYNNANDPTFIERLYPNPFSYQAPTELSDDDYTRSLLDAYREHAIAQL